MNTKANGSTSMPVPEILRQLHTQMYQVAVLRAGLELEVWAKVAAGKDSTDRLSAAENWDPFGTRMLLDDLCTLKLLTKEGDQYRGLYQPLEPLQFQHIHKKTDRESARG